MQCLKKEEAKHWIEKLVASLSVGSGEGLTGPHLVYKIHSTKMWIWRYLETETTVQGTGNRLIAYRKRETVYRLGSKLLIDIYQSLRSDLLPTPAEIGVDGEISEARREQQSRRETAWSHWGLLPYLLLETPWMDRRETLVLRFLDLIQVISRRSEKSG
jgi:hypothetical protein